MPGRDPGGFIITILLGIAGSFVGAFVGSYLHIGAGRFTSFALAIIGSDVVARFVSFSDAGLCVNH
jgi:Transglycosylase associated protein.